MINVETLSIDNFVIVTRIYKITSHTGKHYVYVYIVYIVCIYGYISLWDILKIFKYILLSLLSMVCLHSSTDLRMLF